MKDLAARIISILFHPLLIATYLFSMLSIVLPAALEPINSGGHKDFLLLIFVSTFLLPALNISIFKLLGSIQSFTMYTRKERIMPFTFIAVLYIIVTYFLYANFRISFHDNVLKLMLIIDLLIFAGTFVTYFYKVSLHSLAMCGLVGITISLNRLSEDNLLFLPTIVLIILGGIVMSARLQLHAHTSREVLLGAGIGFVLSLGSTLILF